MPTQTRTTQSAAQKLHSQIEPLLHDFAAALSEESATPHLAEIESLKKELSARNDAFLSEKGKLQDALQSARGVAESLRSENDTLKTEADRMQRELGAKEAEIAALKKQLDAVKS